jgi:hypothetical protein
MRDGCVRTALHRGVTTIIPKGTLRFATGQVPHELPFMQLALSAGVMRR